LLCDRKVAGTNSKEVKTSCNLAESSKEGYDSKKVCYAEDGDDDNFVYFNLYLTGKDSI
jgi:hypothetical protein